MSTSTIELRGEIKELETQSLFLEAMVVVLYTRVPVAEWFITGL